MTDDTFVSTTVRPEDERELIVLREICGELGIEVERVGIRALDPGLACLLVGQAALVHLAIERWQDRRTGGQVIDLRPGADPVAYRDRGVMFGLIVIYAADGTVEVEVKEPASQLTTVINALVTALVGERPQRADQVTSLVRDAVGALVDVGPGAPERPPITS